MGLFPASLSHPDTVSTAVKTPRFGLMQPTDADLVKVGDFSGTNEILDGIPGTVICNTVSDRTGLTWGAAQNGTKVIQLDNNSEWVWVWGSGPGSWQRTNTVGLIKNVIQGAQQSSASPANLIQFLDTGTFNVPGGRAVMLKLRVHADNSNETSVVAVFIKNNGTDLTTPIGFKPGKPANSSSNGFVSEFTYLLAANPLSTTNYRITCHARPASVSVALGGGGTVAIRSSQLFVYEV